MTLIEKKDLLTYIEFRSKKLKEIKADLPNTEPDEKRRGRIIIKTEGRIRELETLRRIIHENSLKHMSKIYS